MNVGFENIVKGIGELGYDINDDNFKGTDERAARGFLQMVLPKKEVEAGIDAMLKKTFPAKYKEMVISKHNVAFGVCPHHLLPVVYRISMAYIPKDKVLGLSKLSRLAKLLARGPVLQEDLTHDLCDILHQRLGTEGAAVYVQGLHMCMAARGIGAHEARLVTNCVTGIFLDNMATRQEFIKLVTDNHPTLV